MSLPPLMSGSASSSRLIAGPDDDDDDDEEEEDGTKMDSTSSMHTVHSSSRPSPILSQVSHHLPVPTPVFDTCAQTVPPSSRALLSVGSHDMDPRRALAARAAARVMSDSPVSVLERYVYRHPRFLSPSLSPLLTLLYVLLPSTFGNDAADTIIYRHFYFIGSLV